MTLQSLQPIVDLISARAGLQIRHRDFDSFSTLLNDRIKALNLSSLEEYYNLLAGKSPPNSGYKLQIRSPILSAEQEWQVLLPKLTIGESYFFRDENQISLLKQTIIPEIIRHKQQTQERSLKVWSAGCSTGEEPYSLAILLKELIPPEEGWKIQVIGTDLNPEYIARAKAGIYTAWSFRQVKPVLQRKYFYHRSETWQVIPTVQNLVKFACSNLVQDQLPDPSLDLYDIDLIICRNVFIYFDAIAIANVLTKFYNCLSPQGYLMAGHTELQGQDVRRFQIKSFPESILYQRSKSTHTPVELGRHSQRELAAPPPAVTPAPTTRPTASKPGSPAQFYVSSQSARTRLSHPQKLTPEPTHTQSAIAQPNLEQQGTTERFVALLNQAKHYANSGEHQKASEVCHQALQVKPFSVEPHQVLAQIAEETGDFEQVKNLLKKIIYLEPDAVLAYLELASVYEREGQSDRALKCRHSALNLVKKLPPNFPLSYRESATAQQLKKYMETTWQISC